MKNIIFIHVVTLGKYQEIFDELCFSIKNSGLIDVIDDIYVGVLGNNGLSSKIIKKNMYVGQSNDIKKFEFFTLEELKTLCDESDEEINVLYIHTKGVTNDSINTKNWRKMMTHFCIDKYKECLEALKQYDICGSNYKVKPFEHFSGNFWWSKSSYIKNLPKISDLNINNRYEAEAWIGKNINKKVKSLFDTDKDLYKEIINPSEYLKLSETIFTLPGKIGDNIFKIPIIYQYCKQGNKKCDILLDNNSGSIFKLLKSQDYINNILFDDGISNYNMGGQPFDFGKNEYLKSIYKNVYHLGFRKHPMDKNLTIFSMNECGLDEQLKDCEILEQKCLNIENKFQNILCIHMESSEEYRNKDVENIIYPIWDDLIQRFNEIYFICKDKKNERYNKYIKNDKVKIFDDNEDMYSVAELLSKSLYIGTYSSIWALGNCLKIPQIVIMNDIDIACRGKKSHKKEIHINGKTENILSIINDIINKENLNV
jgi:hypothetical protein